MGWRSGVVVDRKLHTIPNELHRLHCGLLSSHYLNMNQWRWSYEVLGAPTLSFRSLQLRHPNLDLRRDLPGPESVDVIVTEGN